MDNTQKLPILFIIFIVAVAGGSVFSSDMYLPSFPAMTIAFQTSNQVIQWTFTAYLLSFSLFQFFWGPLSDRFGRRPFILIGLSFIILGSFLCAISTTLSLLFLGRFLQGVGAAAGMGLARTIARDAFEKEQLSQVFSIMGLILATMFAIAPAFGGYLQTFGGWRLSFIFLTLYMLILFIIAIFYLHETHKKPDPDAINLSIVIKNLKILFSSKVFMGFAISYGLTWSGFIAYATLSPFLFQDVLHLTPIQYGHLAVVITLGLISASFINTALVKKLGTQLMMDLGLGLMIIFSLLMYILGFLGYLNVSVVMLPLLFSVMGFGIVSANAGAGALSPFGHIAGIAGAVYGGVQMFVSFITSYAVSQLHTHTQLTLAGTLIVLAILSAIFYYGMALQRK